MKYRYLCIVAFALVVSSCAAAGPKERRRPPDDRPSWTLVFQEDFSDDSFRDKWRLEGLAQLAIRSDGTTKFLEIRTKRSETDAKKRQSVYWCGRRFSGDLRFVFRARGAAGNRSIFYFNANAAKDSGHKSIFEWTRPDADMIRYAGDERLEMYSVGVLRDDQAKCNLRYIGGSAAELYRTLRTGKWKRREELYGRETIIRAYDSPFSGEPGTWFEFDLRVEGGRIALAVEGKQIFDVKDPGDVGAAEHAWTPLTGGGWFAFRNFRPNAVGIDYVRVYERRKE